MPYTEHQPDRGGHKGSAKATVSLPFAQPAVEEPADKPLSSTKVDSQANGKGDKAHIASITTSTSDPYTAARESLDRDGFVVLSASLFPSFDLDNLRAAAIRIFSAARSGKWPYIRTLPKQFPPWPQDPSNGIWGVQHLLHPSNPDHLTFAKSYFDAELLRYVAALIESEQGDLTMELYNMLVRPGHDFALRWHRDDVPATATADEELERLNKPGWHAQWNLALYDDSSLILIPGSHKRARTDIERHADPYESSLPGQITVNLKAGEVAFYNNNILHRGVYDCEKERMTLHGSIGTKAAGTQRARNVLQHGVGEWAKEWDLSKCEGEEWVERAKGMRERLLELGRDSGDVGFYSKDE
ncbi:phytanoyl-CoA dioxygenase family protein [Setomelanomma holmii]|uniref:Phytanoyl-CoA dioxygenase family protein n=1 Tax=Setomelanomma holmii TaxID=210430 RepID=A0A9P4LHG5_9PLEO|nr:phytanoyl-CoA dioxygenase family protein [Setomelanomma holmii]